MYDVLHFFSLYIFKSDFYKQTSSDNIIAQSALSLKVYQAFKK